MICFGIALLFWVLTKLSKDYPAEKEVTLRINTPEGKTFAEQPPPTLLVKLEGRGWELMFDYFTSPEIILRYDLSQSDLTELSETRLRADVNRRIAFGNIRIVELNTNDINLALEDEDTKRVPIVLRDSLTFAPGYHLSKPIRLNPDSVTLTGPITALGSIERWRTDSVVITDLKNTVNRKIALEEPPSGISLKIKEVEAIFQIEQFTEKSFFIPLVVQNAPDSLKYFPETVKVTCVVGLSDYNKITSNDFSVEIDLAKVALSEGKNTIPISLVKEPENAISVQFTPKSAEFFIFKK